MKTIQRERYEKTAATASYSFEVNQLASDAAKRVELGPTTESTAGSSTETKKRGCCVRCVLSRDNIRRSYTDTQLKTWDDLADRVEDALSNKQHSRCLAALKTLTLLICSCGLVWIWIWLVQQLSTYILSWATKECLDFTCVLCQSPPPSTFTPVSVHSRRLYPSRDPSRSRPSRDDWVCHMKDTLIGCLDLDPTNHICCKRLGFTIFKLTQIGFPDRNSRKYS